MELLRVELEQLETTRNRKRESGAREAERERVVVVIGKLEEDLKRWVYSHMIVLFGGSVVRNFADRFTKIVLGYNSAKHSYRRNEMRRLHGKKRDNCCLLGLRAERARSIYGERAVLALRMMRW